MKLDAPFYRLPLRFDADALAAEIAALPEEAWIAHPQRFDGNDYVPLVTPSGAITNEFAGPMASTRFLDSCAYLKEVMATLDCVWGRARLMGLVAGANVPPHVDTNYYWRTHIRVHIPIITNPHVRFSCGDAAVHMAPGECWVFDTFQRHHVENEGDAKRVHLVADTIGGERLWDLVHAAKQPGMAEREPALIARGAGGGRLRFEQANFPAVMNPWEIRGQAAILLRQCPPSSALDTVALHLDRFADAWTAAWAEHEEPAKAAAAFRALANGAFSEMVKTPGGADIRLANGTQLFKVLMQIVFENATESDRVKASKAAALAAHSDQRLAS